MYINFLTRPLCLFFKLFWPKFCTIFSTFLLEKSKDRNRRTRIVAVLFPNFINIFLKQSESSKANFILLLTSDTEVETLLLTKIGLYFLNLFLDLKFIFKNIKTLTTSLLGIRRCSLEFGITCKMLLGY